jgi:hypothetical protein
LSRVIRVSPIREIRDTDRAELRRIFGEGGKVLQLSPIAMTPEELLAEITAFEPDAVFLDATPPPHSRVIRGLSSTIPILESTTELRIASSPQSGSPAAEKVRVLGRRDPTTGEIVSVTDGALKPV